MVNRKTSKLDNSIGFEGFAQFGQQATQLLYNTYLRVVNV